MSLGLMYLDFASLRKVNAEDSKFLDPAAQHNFNFKAELQTLTE